MKTPGHPQLICLVPEPLEAQSPGVSRAALDVPSAAPVYLHLDDAGAPALALEAIPAAHGRITIEALFGPRRPSRLLLHCPPGAAVRINDRPVPRIAVATVRDQIRIADRWLLHVTQFARPQIGPPSDELLGKECPVCRVPFAAETTCYRCPCGSAMHAEESGADGSRLECARVVSVCQHCEQPIVLTPGYAWWPEEVAHA